MNEKTVKTIALTLGIAIIFVIVGGMLLYDYASSSGNNMAATEKTNNNENNKQNISNIKYFSEITLRKYLNLYKTETNFILYIGKPTCPACKTFSPILKSVAKKYNLNIKYLDLTTVDRTKQEYQEFLNLSTFMQEEFTYIPTLVISNEGTFIAGNSGSLDEAEIIDFFKINNIITEEV